MPQHISVRVPWHDHGWDGTVCAHPDLNNACLRLKNIAANKNDKVEMEICGQCMADYSEKLSCISEGAAFMSPYDCVRTTIHPYKNNYSKSHAHFMPTDVLYPAYSIPARPFAWLRKENLDFLATTYNIDYQPKREPVLNFNTAWVQDAENHKAIFKAFYDGIVEDESLCLIYAKQVPFVEDVRRVLVGIGHIKHIVPAVEHNRNTDTGLRSMIWETMVCHSIREDHKDGFVIPYQEMMEYAQSHPEFDMNSITVFAPDDAFEEFSYASEHVTYDSVIDVLQSCIKAFEIINQCLDEDYSNVLNWLNDELAKVWEDRGAFPGLGAMLCAMEVRQGILIAKRIQERLKNEPNTDIWDMLDNVLEKPEQYLELELAKHITPILQKTWKNMPTERKTLFRLLSRFSLSINQATVLFHEDERVKRNIQCSDRDIIENPYIIYEQTRLKTDDLQISVRKVDRAVFPVSSVLEKYPLEAPSKLTSENDERRVRAITESVLELEANAGNTILPKNALVSKIRETILDPVCSVTGDILLAIDQFLTKEVIRREMKDGTDYYKLTRLNAFDEIIEKRISKRINASKLEINADWQALLEERFSGNQQLIIVSAEKEKQAREEKIAVLTEIAQSRISVLVGDAGTGKTTVLSVLCSQSEIKAGGVLLLAPTGKATVRLQESMGEVGKNLSAMNVAQFLVRSGRFDGQDMRYQLSDYNYTDVPETVIIDEASMLTEEMFGALIQALGKAKRIIFVGDPNQLPPIGPGRPFVDLVSLLRMNLKKGVFPRVCNCYGELTVNLRQQDDHRLDVKLSKLFTNTDDAVEDDVIADICESANQNIEIVQWSAKEDLEEKLLSFIVRETGMNSAEDVEGFDLALGGTKGDYGVFFNTGCAKAAEKWQILAPVRNMPQGTMNMNRLIHANYREKFLEVSKRKGYMKRIAEAVGPESIVYGDKVINIANKSRDGWPKDKARGYVANGEIGIVCGRYTAKNPNDYVNVEFSSQQNVQYTYINKEFGEENIAPLELAYALTVHKAQGSQFDTVILVLAEPCGIISREMLYTALTRQKKKIIILYNQEPYHLLNYSSAENSTIAQRFTDLFAPVFKDETNDMRPSLKEVKGKFYEDRLIHRTVRGELVRSKSEVIIANALYYKNLDYQYEPVLELGGHICRPDFVIADEDTGDKWYWEHCGIMDDPGYRKRWEDKKAFYKKHGIEEGKNLIVTYDQEGAFDSQVVDQIINDIFEY